METVWQATKAVERFLSGHGGFQYLAILHEDRVTRIRAGRREFGLKSLSSWQKKLSGTSPAS